MTQGEKNVYDVHTQKKAFESRVKPSKKLSLSKNTLVDALREVLKKGKFVEKLASCSCLVGIKNISSQPIIN